MKSSQIKGEYIREYVLGTHDPENQREFEERLLTDEDLLEQLSIVEDELVCEYLSGSLSELKREKFENRFLTTAAGKQKLQFFRALNNHVEDPAVARTSLPRSWKRFLPAFLRGESPWLRMSFAMAILILIFVGVFAFFRNPADEHGAVFTATLVPGQVKIIGGRKMNVVEVPPGTGVINLKLEIGEVSAQSYHASIFTDQGEEVFTRDALQAESGLEGNFVSVRVSSSVLKSGDHRLKLKAQVVGVGSEDVASYSFRVTK